MKLLLLECNLMKDYEIYSSLRIPKNFDIVLRIDGRSFHNLSNFLDLDKPMDINFTNLMVDVCEDLFNEFSPLFIYTFSDEINILLDNIPFNGRIEKIDSIFSSFTGSSFTSHFPDYFRKELYKPVSFDCRTIPIDSLSVSDYFKWRQDEAWRNCVNGHGVWFCKKNNIPLNNMNGLKNSDVHEMLFKGGINLNDIENWKKRGIGLYKKQKEIKGFNRKDNVPTISYRNFIYKDFNLPIFSQNFFKDL